MTPEEKFLSMVKNSKELIEDFNDFADDQAIVWAANEIKNLRLLLKKYYVYVQDTTSDTMYDLDSYLANLDADAYLYLWNCGMLNEK
jgi:hypothetical protein